MFKQAIGYVEEKDFLGGVTNFNFVTNEVTLEDDEDKTMVVDVGEVELMFEAFEFHGLTIFNKDILGAVNGKLYQVELFKDGDVQLHHIDEKLELIASGEKFTPDTKTIEQLEKVMDLQGNYYEVLATIPQNPEFNVKIVKKFDGTYFTYFYACNDKTAEQIDLIKVLYMGHHLLEEEDYERETISYEDYLTRIENGSLKEVTPQELHNYVTGASYSTGGAKVVATGAITLTDLYSTQAVEDEDEDENEDETCEDIATCEECGNEEDDCDCYLWN